MAHIPERMCIVCRTRRPAGELFRLRADKLSGTVVADTHTKQPGRGAYICRNIECIRLAEKKDAPRRHLKLAVCEGLYRQLEDML